MKTIHVDAMNTASVKAAIAELQSVKREWERKGKLCCEAIAAALAEEIEKNFLNIPFSDDLFNVKTHQAIKTTPVWGVEAKGNTVVVKENGAELAFIEFGAGISHNAGRSNPLSEKVSFDTAIGSYGQGHGTQPYWFVAHNLISYGTPAYMPIYNAIEAVKPMIPTICRGIFV